MNDPAPQDNEITNIIKILNGGIEFYQDGLNKLNDTNKKVLFKRIIEEKKEAVTALQPYAKARQGDVQTRNDLDVVVTSMYAHLVAALSTNEEHKYINELEEVENKVLKRFDKALDVDQPSDCAAELRRIRTRLQQCHDEMKTIQVETI